MAQEKEAKRVVQLEDIKFNEANKGMAALATVPFWIISLVLLIVEKEDLMVRYNAAQFGILSLLLFFVWFPCIGQILGLLVLVAFVVGLMKTLKGERFDVPMISDLALKVMNAI